MMDKSDFSAVEKWFKKLVDLEKTKQKDQAKHLLAKNILSNEQFTLLINMLAADQRPDFPENLNNFKTNWAKTDETIQLQQMPHIGNYQLIKPLGTGGMGHVYLAERNDGLFEQHVAIKISQLYLKETLLKKFENERQILAKLTHPNIAKLLDGGTADDGRPYIVMEYINGVDIDQYCIKEKLGLNGRLNLVLQICSAVSYAHQQLVMHRDLKPSNILVDHSGQVKLVDFGIAKLLENDDQSVNPTATQIMTRQYASPEQLKGDPLSTRSDLFSLGVLTYELLTGFHPFAHNNQLERDQNVISGTIRKISRENQSKAVFPQLSDIAVRQLQGDIENILNKSLAVNPEDRYQSINAFASDIRNYMEYRPVMARKASNWDKIKKWMIRHKAVTTISATSLTLLILTTMIAVFQANIAKKQQSLAEQQQLLAEAETLKATEIKDFMVNLLQQATPREDGEKLLVRDVLDQGMEKLQADIANHPEQKFAMLNAIIASYIGLNEYNLLQEKMPNFLEKCKLLLNDAHKHCINMEINYGVVLFDIGQDEESLKYLQTLEKRLRTELPQLKEELGLVLRNQFTPLNRLKRFDQAIAKYQEGIEIYRQNEDEIDFRVLLNWFHNLTYLMLKNKQLDNAKPKIDAIQKLLEENKEATPKDYAMNQVLYSLYYHYRGEEIKSLPYRKKAIEILKKAPEHRTETLYNIMKNYAAALNTLGYTDQALAVYDETLDIINAYNNQVPEYWAWLYVRKGLIQLQLFNSQSAQMVWEKLQTLDQAGNILINRYQKCHYLFYQMLIILHTQQKPDHELTTELISCDQDSFNDMSSYVAYIRGLIASQNNEHDAARDWLRQAKNYAETALTPHLGLTAMIDETMRRLGYFE